MPALSEEQRKDIATGLRGFIAAIGEDPKNIAVEDRVAELDAKGNVLRTLPYKLVIKSRVVPDKEAYTDGGFNRYKLGDFTKFLSRKGILNAKEKAPDGSTTSLHTMGGAFPEIYIDQIVPDKYEEIFGKNGKLRNSRRELFEKIQEVCFEAEQKQGGQILLPKNDPVVLALKLSGFGPEMTKETTGDDGLKKAVFDAFTFDFQEATFPFLENAKNIDKIGNNYQIIDALCDACYTVINQTAKAQAAPLRVGLGPSCYGRSQDITITSFDKEILDLVKSILPPDVEAKFDPQNMLELHIDPATCRTLAGQAGSAELFRKADRACQAMATQR